MDNENDEPLTLSSRIKNLISNVNDQRKTFAHFAYNSDEKTVLGRTGISWAKILGFYTVFFTFLFGFLAALLALFFGVFINNVVPRYFSEGSVMSSRATVNPGLGFRPQVDVKNGLISYTKLNSDSQFILLNESLSGFLMSKYNRNETNSIDDCGVLNITLDELRETRLSKGYHCNYNYHQVLNETTCSMATGYGYLGEGPCVAVKLNRIYSWLPVPYDNFESLPDVIKYADELNNTDLIQKNIFIKCEGDFTADQQVFANISVIYYSAESKELNITNIGLIPTYYYPYLNQNGYESPLVFVQFRNMPKDKLVNIICRAYAQNIDSEDKNRYRGLTQFQIQIK